MSADPAELGHPIHDLPEAERVEYLLAVASLVVVDGAASPAAIERLRVLGREAGLTASDAAAVLASASIPDLKRVDAELARVSKRPELATSLLADAIAIAFSSDQLAAAKGATLARMGERLGLNVAQAELIARYVESVRMGGEHAAHPHLAKELGEALVGAHAKTGSGVLWLSRIMHAYRDR
jgi:hypothetical protein